MDKGTSKQFEEVNEKLNTITAFLLVLVGEKIPNKTLQNEYYEKARSLFDLLGESE